MADVQSRLAVGSGKYAGKYVTLRDYGTEEVITSGKNPVTVYRRAQKKGVKNPVLFFVPAADTVHVY